MLHESLFSLKRKWEGGREGERVRRRNGLEFYVVTFVNDPKDPLVHSYSRQASLKKERQEPKRVGRKGIDL